MRSGLRARRGVDLLRDDLPDEAPAHREVRVGEVHDLLREHFGDAVGPAAMAAGRVRLRVADALRERVAEGDHAAPGVRLRVLEVRVVVLVVRRHGFFLGS